VEGAYRFSDYSTVGTTDSYKGGLRWEINDTVALRGSGARSVRAPNISELFLPRSQTFSTLSDPCDDDNYQAGINPAVREANCRAALGYGANDPYTFNNTTSSSVEGVIAGNENLEPETADTFTAGIVLTPSFIPGFSLAIDYYDIKLENAVQFFSAQAIVNKCYDLPQPNQFCGMLTRDGGTNFIDSFEQSGVNVAQYTTSGWDLSVRYVMDPANFGIERDIGRFGFSLTANKLEDLTFTEDASDPLSSDQTVGQAFVPEWSGNLDLTWEWRKLFVNYGFNYWSETRRYEGRPDDFIAPEYVDYSARKTHDIQVRYTFDERISAYGGVNNIGDQGPDRGVLEYPVNPLGRYFYLGLNYKM
jgi:outer membrane receptor protein involved in Fe transport